tara:strand:- start:39 stop:503 length:465 start_codon:yes stop_codon:yes gene_type:complete
MFDPGPLKDCNNKLAESFAKTDSFLFRERQPRGKIIYVVDDDRIDRQIAERILGRAGYTVLMGSGGQDFFAAVAVEDIGFLITDLGLPLEPGIDILNALDKKERIGAMVVSGMAEDDNLVKEIISRDIPFLQKPYDEKELLKIVVDYFGEPDNE